MGYFNTFIVVSEDCAIKTGVIPEEKHGKKTAASIQYELLSKSPYKYTQEDVLFQTYLIQNQLQGQEMEQLRIEFFSKPKACLRTSPLVKKYGWGLHFNDAGKIAIFGVETEEYKNLSLSDKNKVVKGMRSKRE